MTEAVQTDVQTGSYTKQHAKVARFEISVGADDDDRTLDTFIEHIKAALGVEPVSAHNVTYQGGYYLIDGKVCLEQDYDPATKNRKPGTFPPVWAGGPDPKKQQLTLVTDDDDEDDSESREFVRVKPTINRRDPLTGRRARKDKGVKRGPRKPVSDDAKAAIAKMGKELRESQT
jgi:hypothetical protein